MKHIICPIDFSPSSINALHYAAAFCADTGAVLVVIHGYQLSSHRASAARLGSLEKQIGEDAYEQMDELVDALKAEFKDALSILAKPIRGDVQTVIQRIAKQFNADLIIIGNKGESDDPEIFMGSITSGLIKNTDIPLMVIPQSSVYQAIHRIAVAVKTPYYFRKSTVRPLTKLIKTFKSHIDLIHIVISDYTPPARPSTSFNETFTIQETLLLESETVTDGLNKLKLDSKYELLAVIRRQRGFFNRIFNATKTSKQSFNVNIPMLVLQGVKE